MHEQMFTLDCAVGRAPLGGRARAGHCDGARRFDQPNPAALSAASCGRAMRQQWRRYLEIETPVDTGLSQLSTPLSTAASHITYAP